MAPSTRKFGTEDQVTLLWNTNNLLASAGIQGKKLKSISELLRVSSSLFVAVYESLLKTRLPGVIRSPQTKEDYVSNVQRVIDGLSRLMQIDLRHIRGRAIVQGEFSALSNLVQILIRVHSITGQETATNTTESITSRSSDFVAGISDTDLLPLRSPSSRSPRRRNENEQAMLRNVYAGLLSTMRSWEQSEILESHERIRRIKNDAKIAIQSLRVHFDERVKIIREYSYRSAESGDEQEQTQQNVRYQLSRATSDRQARMLETNKAVMNQLRHSELMRGRESGKVFQTLSNS